MLRARGGRGLEGMRAWFPDTLSRLELTAPVGAGLEEPVIRLAWGAGVLVVGFTGEQPVRRFTGKLAVGLGDVRYAAAWALDFG